MATQLIALGSTAASSSDVVVTAGAPVTVAIDDPAGPDAKLLIELKDAQSQYNVVGSLTPTQPSAVIAGPGVYRLTRVAGVACGAYSG